MSERVAQVRGTVAERVILSSELDPFMPLCALATYSGLGTRRLRAYLTDLRHPLPCYRIGVKILVRRSEFDTWIGAFRQVGVPDVDRIVAEVFTSTRGR